MLDGLLFGGAAENVGLPSTSVVLPRSSTCRSACSGSKRPGRTVDDVSADSPHGPRPQGHRRLSHGRRKHRRSGPPSDPEACPAGARRSGCRWARSPSARGHRETDGLWVPMGRVNRTSSKSLVHHQFVGHRTRPAQGGTSTRISPTERRRSRRSPIFRRTARHGTLQGPRRSSRHERDGRA